VTRKFVILTAAAGLVLAIAPAQAALAAPSAAAPATATPATAACTHWKHVSSPNAGTSINNLFGVTAVSARNAWTVGEYFVGANTKTLTEHWNGHRWKHVGSPNKGVGAQLNAVWAQSATNVWAAGSYTGSSGRTLIVHWNGHHWKRIPSPNMGSGSNELTSIRGTSAHDVWAVGDAVTSYPVTKTVILHWNGHHWRTVSSPSVPSSPNFLTSVRPVSRTSAWAVGRYVGSSFSKTLILHWNGHHWRKVSSPNPGAGDNLLRGVMATSSKNAWAVGVSSNSGPDKTLVLHWNGRHWKHVDSPSVGSNGSDLYGVGGSSSGNVYAVGVIDHSTSTSTLVEHWNGQRWKRIPSPTPGTGANLSAVYVRSAASIWAVGTWDKGGSPSRTLVEHCR
jgi:hypothetical protein